MIKSKRTLAIPLNELREHLATNNRLDVKVVVAAIMNDDLFDFLKSKKKDPIMEASLEGDCWKHTPGKEDNLVVEASEFNYESLA